MYRYTHTALSASYGTVYTCPMGRLQRWCMYLIVCDAVLVIKTHGSVSCGPRSRRATPVSILTGRTKTSFSHLCISVITYLIGTKFATQLPASQGSLHSKFEGNRSSHFRDTSCQSFVFFSSFFFFSSSSFRTLAKIAITSKRVFRSP